jgi:hypothetical protein
MVCVRPSVRPSVRPCDVAQGVAVPNVTLINPFYIGPYEGYLYVCLGCHNLHLHYKRLLNLSFLVSREYKNTLFSHGWAFIFEFYP